jgi:hypothetical protein
LGTEHAYEVKNAYNILVGKPKEKHQLEDLGIDGNIY